jgi:hypothetical protein
MITGTNGASQRFFGSALTSTFIEECRRPGSERRVALTKLVNFVTKPGEVRPDPVKVKVNLVEPDQTVPSSPYPRSEAISRLASGDVINASPMLHKLMELRGKTLKTDSNAGPVVAPNVAAAVPRTVYDYGLRGIGRQGYNHIIHPSVQITPYVLDTEKYDKLNYATSTAGLALGTLLEFPSIEETSPSVRGESVKVSYDIDAPSWIVRVLSLASRGTSNDDIRFYARFASGPDVELLYAYMSAFQFGIDVRTLIVIGHYERILERGGLPTLTRKTCEAIDIYVGNNEHIGSPQVENYARLWNGMNDVVRDPAALPLRGTTKGVLRRGIEDSTYKEAIASLQKLKSVLNPHFTIAEDSRELIAKQHAQMQISDVSLCIIPVGAHVTDLLTVASEWLASVGGLKFKTDLNVPGSTAIVNAQRHSEDLEQRVPEKLDKILKRPYITIKRHVYDNDEDSAEFVFENRSYYVRTYDNAKSGHDFTIYNVSNYIFTKLIETYGYALPALYINEIERDIPNKAAHEVNVVEAGRLREILRQCEDSIDHSTRELSSLESRSKSSDVKVGEKRRLKEEMTTLQNSIATTTTSKTRTLQELEEVRIRIASYERKIAGGYVKKLESAKRIADYLFGTVSKTGTEHEAFKFPIFPGETYDIAELSANLDFRISITNPIVVRFLTQFAPMLKKAPGLCELFGTRKNVKFYAGESVRVHTHKRGETFFRDVRPSFIGMIVQEIRENQMGTHGVIVDESNASDLPSFEGLLKVNSIPELPSPYAIQRIHSFGDASQLQNVPRELIIEALLSMSAQGRYGLGLKGIDTDEGVHNFFRTKVQNDILSMATSICNATKSGSYSTIRDVVHLIETIIDQFKAVPKVRYGPLVSDIIYACNSVKTGTKSMLDALNDIQNLSSKTPAKRHKADEHTVQLQLYSKQFSAARINIFESVSALIKKIGSLGSKGAVSAVTVNVTEISPVINEPINSLDQTSDFVRNVLERREKVIGLLKDLENPYVVNEIVEVERYNTLVTTIKEQLADTDYAMQNQYIGKVPLPTPESIVKCAKNIGIHIWAPIPDAFYDYATKMQELYDFETFLKMLDIHVKEARDNLWHLVHMSVCKDEYCTGCAVGVIEPSDEDVLKISAGLACLNCYVDIENFTGTFDEGMPFVQPDLEEFVNNVIPEEYVPMLKSLTEAYIAIEEMVNKMAPYDLYKQIRGDSEDVAQMLYCIYMCPAIVDAIWTKRVSASFIRGGRKTFDTFYNRIDEMYANVEEGERIVCKSRFSKDVEAEASLYDAHCLAN